MSKRKLVDSFTDAINGILRAIRTERNMRVHFIMAGLVLILSAFTDLGRWEVVALLVTIAAVIMGELFNTALEAVVDLVSPDYHPLAERAKQVAAGGVLVAAVISVLIGAIIFIPRLINFHPLLLRKVAQVPAYLSVVAIALCLLTILLAKALPTGEFFLQGGMPSGHSAVSFALSTLTLFLSRSWLVYLISLSIAALVAQSRVEGKIHTPKEVFAGAILGILVVGLVFQLGGYGF
jgi:diacylglycerol kinase (ATP)